MLCDRDQKQKFDTLVYSREMSHVKPRFGDAGCLRSSSQYIIFCWCVVGSTYTEHFREETASGHREYLGSE
jgi:hypothetical protein